MEHTMLEWSAFLGFVLAMLALDLGVFNRKDHVVGPKEALGWSALWIALALAFGGYVWLRHGSEPGLQFLTGYVIEKSLSVDNIFVFVVIFGALGIPPLYQHRVLFWGILSALVLRGAMIAAGSALLHRFHWIIYVFGAFLVLTGVKLLWARGGAEHPEKSAVFKFLRRVIPASPRLDGNHFFTKENGKWLATPLFFALALVEITDVIFAVDSIPAIFAVTSDPYIVFTSNVFAILGLRSLYFLLASFVEKFTYLKPSLAFVLMFVGAKMALVDVVKIHAGASLAVVLGILTTGIVASVLRNRRDAAAAAATGGTALPPSPAP
ncbi:MAG TPA: TerC family protein, partial [Anaeromyxobacteraceae bacterium]|nr:TerC family protein [Anaeromyxobacteraceae bacterium]